MDIYHLEMKYVICRCPQFAVFIFVGARGMMRRPILTVLTLFDDCINSILNMLKTNYLRKVTHRLINNGLYTKDVEAGIWKKC